MTSVVVVDGGGAVLEYVSDAEVVSQVRGYTLMLAQSHVWSFVTLKTRIHLLC